MTAVTAITLPSFIRRTTSSDKLKRYMKALGCELQRIGRSRHWQLKATYQQQQDIILFIEQANEQSWLWLHKLIKKECPPLNHQSLLAFAANMEIITASALITKTHCTLAQARKVLDELENLD